MQYFRPEAPYFVGDCMPFFHDGVYHLYYLVDEGHHAGLGGLGGHQWAHASTVDLVNWEHHPMALTITEDWEGSICTGSVFWHDNVYYAFFAVRTREWKERLAYATSPDGITWQKQSPYPLQSAPDGYDPGAFRDPFVFRGNDGTFHLLVTAKVSDYAIHDRGACLLRLSSSDLTHWTPESPFLLPVTSAEPSYTPECSDYFPWNDWYYLIFGCANGPTRYRMSRDPFGPWIRPVVDALDGPITSVMKTAPFVGNRRIGAAWLPSRYEDRNWKFGGNAVFRELLQNPDGTLGVKNPPEMIPFTGAAISPVFQASTAGAAGDGQRVVITAPGQQEAGAFLGVPADYRLRCRIEASGTGVHFGLGVRGEKHMEKACEIGFIPGLKRVVLGDLLLEGVEGLDQPFDIDLFVTGSIIDLCIDNRRCIINRWPYSEGNRLYFWCANGNAAFSDIELRPLM